MPHILIVENDALLGCDIERILKNDKNRFVLCDTVAKAREAVRTVRFNLIILDIGLSDEAMLDFCREIRGQIFAPILFLTANATEMDAVANLKLGDDELLAKPFSLDALRVRVNTLLRRRANASAGSVAKSKS
jgi:DNA-binding response OmpR family regulator